MKTLRFILFVFLIGLAIPSWCQDKSEPASGNDAMIAKCTKILSYGSIYGYYNPKKSDAVIALGLLGDERVVPMLIEHLQNEGDNQLRMDITKALGWIGSKNAVSALEQALHDKYPHVRKVAAMALKEITGKDYDYDKTGLADLNKLKEQIRSSTNRSDKATENEP